MENLDEEDTAPPRPPILIAFLVLAIVQLLIAAALVVLMAVLAYVGFDTASSLALNTSCTDQYTVRKYDTLLEESVSIRFLGACVAAGLSIAILVIAIKTVVTKPIGTSMLSKAGIRAWMGLPSYVACYILESILILSAITVFGFYLGLLIKGQSQCSWAKINKKELIIITVISGALLVLAIVIWILILCICKRANQSNEQDYQQNGNKESGANKREEQGTPGSDRKALLHKQPIQAKQIQLFGVRQTPQKTNQQKKANIWDRSQDVKVIQKEDEPEQVVQNYTPIRQKQNRDHLLSKYGNSGGDSSQHQPRLIGSIFKAQNKQSENESRTPIKSIYQRQEYNPSFPGSNSNTKGIPFDRTVSRQRFQQQQQSYLAENSNRKILDSGRDYEGSRPKLHSTYFKDETSMLSKNKYQEGGRKRKGILTDYLRGKYAG